MQEVAVKKLKEVDNNIRALFVQVRLLAVPRAAYIAHIHTWSVLPVRQGNLGIDMP